MRNSSLVVDVGKSTAEAMRIGAQLGYRGMVREILGELKSELGNGTKVCATGGFPSGFFRILTTPS